IRQNHDIRPGVLAEVVGVTNRAVHYLDLSKGDEVVEHFADDRRGCLAVADDVSDYERNRKPRLFSTQLPDCLAEHVEPLRQLPGSRAKDTNFFRVLFSRMLAELLDERAV